MGFIEFYNQNKKKRSFWSSDCLPDDVRKDLFNLLENDDKRIGFIIFHVYVIQKNGSRECDGMDIGYYVRSWHPTFIYTNIKLHDIPCGLRFWRMKRCSIA